MTVIDTATHAILAAVASVGPTPDVDQLEGVMGKLPVWIAMHHLVADAGFDSASNHRMLRESLAMRSTIPPNAGRPTRDPKTLPTDKYRRRMKTHFNKKAYGHRPQAETVFSMMKRNFGSFLRARTHQGRMRDMMLKVLTHNLALALLWVFYRADPSPFHFQLRPRFISQRNCHEPDRRVLARKTANPSTLPHGALCRYDPRQEPGAVVPLAGICAGATGNHRPYRDSRYITVYGSRPL